MPRSITPANVATPSRVIHADDALANPMDLLRARADRLGRAALESCRQHERCAALVEKDGIDPQELDGWLELTAMADRQLGEAGTAYEKATAALKSDAEDLPWRRQASVLWLAAREHVRRQSQGDKLAGRVSRAHRADFLGELHVAFELEASAVLSLRQAAEGYCRARPEVLAVNG